MKTKNNKLFIGLAGPMASGKGTVARMLADEYGASVYRFSEVFREVLSTMGLEVSRSNMQLLSTTLRKMLGEGVFSKALLNKVAKDKRELIVVDGFRRIEELEDFKKNSNFFLIGIEAKPEMRYDRTVNRLENKGDWKKSYEDFLFDEKNEADKKIVSVLRKADFRVKNNSTVVELKDSIRAIMEKLVVKGKK